MPPNKGTSRAKRRLLSPQYCEVPKCGYKAFIERHRIVAGRHGGLYELGNVISLCPNHHKEADAGILTISVLKAIVRDRIQYEQNEQRTQGIGFSESEGNGLAYESSASNGNGSGHREHDFQSGCSQAGCGFSFTADDRPEDGFYSADDSTASAESDSIISDS